MLQTELIAIKCQRKIYEFTIERNPIKSANFSLECEMFDLDSARDQKVLVSRGDLKIEPTETRRIESKKAQMFSFHFAQNFSNFNSSH